MGIGYASIIDRCKLPIDKRYQNIAELKCAFGNKKVQKRRYVLLVAVVAVAILVMAGFLGRNTLGQDKMSEAIEKGKAFVDKRMDDTGITEFLDTLSSMQYYNPLFFERINDGMTAVDDYAKQIKADYTEEELAIIRETLISHQGERQKAWVDKYNQIKEAYDREIMQGD